MTLYHANRFNARASSRRSQVRARPQLKAMPAILDVKTRHYQDTSRVVVRRLLPDHLRPLHLLPQRGGRAEKRGTERDAVGSQGGRATAACRRHALNFHCAWHLNFQAFR